MDKTTPAQVPATSASAPTNLFVVGIGASAGGLEALEAFFATLPTKLGQHLCFVVVQHLAKRHKSVIDQLIGRHTELETCIPEEDMELAAGKIFLNPPGKRFMLQGKRLCLADAPEGAGEHFPIDAFFQVLAQEREGRCAGIILSGTGSDGSQGIRAIKAGHGLVIIQAPESAAFDGMPNRAMETGLADFVLPPTDMPKALAQYLTQEIHQPVDTDIIEEEAYHAILQTLKQQTQTDFHRYKPETLRRRIIRRMHLLQLENPAEYQQYLQANREEVIALRKDMFIGLTRFFRDPDVFAYLKREVLPKILEKEEEDLRLWVPACATGEEAYSMAILLLELQAETASYRAKQIKIFATDPDETAIRFGSRGVYPESIASDVSRGRLARFFQHTGHGYQVKKHLREMIVFTPQNLVQDAPFHRLDLISCRNMLIYLQPVLQQKLFAVFNFALRPHGYLLLGPHESAESYPEIFQRLDSDHQIYQSVFQSRPRPNRATRERLSSNANSLSATISRQAFRNRVLEVTNDIMAAELQAACLVVNEDFELLRYFGDAPRYLEVPREPTSWNLLRMVGPELSATISAGLRRASEKEEPVVYSPIRTLPRDGSSQPLELKIIPHRVESHDQLLFHIIIREVRVATTAQPVTIGTDDQHLVHDAAQRIGDLEQELHVTRENLQATIEELQTSNEELLSANEELQGTNEELQSVNEELYTINAEHQDTITALTGLNNDMDNLLQNSKIGIIFLDANLCIRRFNQSATQEIFIAPQDIGRPLEHFSTRLTYKNMVEDARRVIAEKQAFQLEVSSQNGKWYILRIMPYLGQDQAVTGVVISLADISEVKDSEHLRELLGKLETMQQALDGAKEEVKRTEQRIETYQRSMQALMKGRPELFIRIDQHGRVLYYQTSERFLKSFSAEHVPLQGPNIREHLPEDFLTPVLRKARESGSDSLLPAFHFEWGKAEIPFRAQFFRLDRGESGILIQNQTEEQARTHQVRYHEELSALIARNIPDSFVVVFDEALRISFAEGAISTRLKVGKTITDSFPKPIAEKVVDACHAALAKRPVTQELSWDDDFFISQTMPILDEKGKPEGGILLIQLVNDMKRVQHALEAKVADLEQFAFSVSHDLKSPLRSISGFAQLLQKRYLDKLDESGREYLDLIVSNTISMTELINGVLEYARLGQAEITFDAVDLKQVIHKVTENLSGQLRAGQDAIVVRSDLPIVHGQQAQLTQLFQNLIENGLKFNQAEKKVVSIAVTEEKAHWVISIEDNGIGIEPRYHEQIFSIFKFLNDRRTYSGNGIGLAVCRRIVERMNGHIWVESNLGKGTRFLIRLPQKNPVITQVAPVGAS
ncbi:MAG: GHKL domain-containing protein [Bacteroidetes bacterium]|nr:MAG: GHKL domain-containing protein [Bacteroidota bacterium]